MCAELYNVLLGFLFAERLKHPNFNQKIKKKRKTSVRGLFV